MPAAIRALMHSAPHFGGNDHLTPVGEVLNCAPEDFLALTVGIDIGRIEKIDPQFEGFLDNQPAVFLINNLFVKRTFRVSKPHATEADARDFRPC
jgi:hypothetical protein